jgi:proton glutamate symport protein
VFLRRASYHVAATNKPKSGSRRLSAGQSKKIAFAAGLLLYILGAVMLALAGAHTTSLLLRCLGLCLMACAAIFRRSLSFWIFLGLLMGLEIGLDRPQFAEHLRIFSDIFLRLIKVIVAPLIIGTLITGIAGHGDLKRVGRIGWKSLVYFEIVTTLAIFLGVASINLTRAGEGLMVPAVAGEQTALAPVALQWQDFVLHIFPENIVKSIGDNQILQIVVFAVLFAIALTRVPEKSRQPILSLAESLTQTMFRFTNIVIYLAPLGVAGAMAYTVGHMGMKVLLPLLNLIFTVYAAYAALIILVLIPVILIARVPLVRFIKYVAEPATIAFATSTSEAALPCAMESMELLGVPRQIVAFVIPAGYSFNMDGGSVWLAVAALFLAQTAGISMPWQQQLILVFTLMVTSKGIAGVPRASLVVLIATAAALHLPTAAVVLLLGADGIVDMGRTAVNVIGNCLASAVIARWEGESLTPRESMTTEGTTL